MYVTIYKKNIDSKLDIDMFNIVQKYFKIKYKMNSSGWVFNKFKKIKKSAIKNFEIETLKLWFILQFYLNKMFFYVFVQNV